MQISSFHHWTLRSSQEFLLALKFTMVLLMNNLSKLHLQQELTALLICVRTAASILSAVENAMTTYSTTKVTLVGHSLGK